MLNSDVSTLNALIADDLIFTTHLGQVIGKMDDLNAHRDGVIAIQGIILSDQRIQYTNDFAIVSVQANIIGTFAGKKLEGNFRFTRVWVPSLKGKWQVMAGHSSMLA